MLRGTRGVLGSTRVRTHTHSKANATTHAHARTHERMCVCARAGHERVCLRVSESVRVLMRAGLCPRACVRGCAAASMRMCGVHARLRACLCAHLRAHAGPCVRARARLCVRSCARASVRVRVCFAGPSAKHLRACVRACVRAHMCGTPVRVRLGGCKPAVLIARPAAPGGRARAVAVRRDRR